MVTNVGVAVGIGSQAQSFQLLFPFPVSVAAVLIFGSQPTSGNVESARDVFVMVAKVGVAVGIVPPADCVQ